ncbi:MAG: hypothetical protein ACM31C_04460 [Acidobacteriota bacterium]
MAGSDESEEGAPVPKDKIDPDLVKLSRPRPRIGVVTAAGIVFLSVLFLWRINGDRKFSGADDKPQHVSVADVAAGKIAEDRYVSLDPTAEPLMARAMRVSGTPGMRVAPVRGTSEKLWLVVPGDGWEPPQLAGYTGRLRRLADLPFWAAVRDYAAAHPQPVFAAASAVRAGFASGQVATVSGDIVQLHDSDRVAFEVIEPDVAVIVATLEDRLPDAAAWTKALTEAGITPSGVQPGRDVARFQVSAPNAVATLTDKLQQAELWAARVEPVTHHHETTWGEVKGSSPAGFVAKGVVIPDAQLDLVGLYVSRSIPSDAYALLTAEKPEDYWYVLPVTVVVGVIGLLFAWALVRAVKRDLLPSAPPAAS